MTYMLRQCLLAFIILFSFSAYSAVTADCEAALKTLFAGQISKSEASDFLKVQGDITLHRLAWAYLKAQKSDNSKKLENVERTILTLLDDKYTSTDPGFKKARDLFESQPLSRTALAEIGPYLKEVLSHEFSEGSDAYILNSSDLKLLHSLAKFEKEKALNGKYDSRMLDRKSSEGMLNFAKLINSSYKISPSSTEEYLGVELKLKGLENTIGNLQKRISDFIRKLDAPSECLTDSSCDASDIDLAEIFNQNENIQNIFWESLSEKLGSDDLLLDNLTYGEIWLKTGKNPVKSGPAVIGSTIKVRASIPQTSTKAAIIEKEISTQKPPSSINPTKTIVANKITYSQPSVVKEYYSNTGLKLKDPIDIILKDKANRKAENWKKFDQIFLRKMADAILNDDKVFEVDGKIFDRSTGKNLSLDDALKFLPPEKRAATNASLLTDADKEMMRKFPGKVMGDHRAKGPLSNKLVAAVINGDKTFIHANQLYNSSGKALDPASTIASEKSRIENRIVVSLNYKGMDKSYLNARANALSNRQPKFTMGDQVFDTATGRNLFSPFRSLATSQDVKLEKQKRIQYENLPDEDVIVNYYRDNSKNVGCPHYAIVDKKNARVKVYTLNGTQVFEANVLLGTNKSDAKTRWAAYDDVKHESNSTTGAGMFTIGEKSSNNAYKRYYQSTFNNNLLPVAESSIFAIHQVPNNLAARRNALFNTGKVEDRRTTGGCVNLKQSDFLKFAGWIKPTCKVYVLPEDAHNKFQVKDGKLEFISTKNISLNERSNYHYSSSPNKYKDINFRITDKRGKTIFSEPFVKALDVEKEKLMKVLRLSNDEYNDLALVAYGILGQETKFGTSPKLWLKEISPMKVILGKMGKKIWNLENPLSKDVINLSRGLTQIKDMPDGEWKKVYPEISKLTLDHPRHAAIATIAYLADAMKVLKVAAKENEKNGNTNVRITKEHLVDFMGYAYQGNRRALTSKDNPATPDFNTYVQGLRRNMSYAELTQKIE